MIGAVARRDAPRPATVCDGGSTLPPMDDATTAFVVSQGEELLTGLTVDTNANHLCGALTRAGLRVVGAATAGDDRTVIARALADAASKADVVLCTGGLGPTEDDLTADAVVEAFGGELALDEEAWSQVQARYEAIGRAMSMTNRKQALLPVGSDVIENRLGTAPGFAIDGGGARLYFMPGVPREMKAMLKERVLPEIVDRFAPRAPLRHTFRVMGRGESQLQEQLGALSSTFPGVILGFRTRMPENHVKLAASSECPVWEEAKAWVRERLGENCFSEEPDEELAAVVGEMLVARGQTLALAESCTGGWIAHLCVTEAGSSRWLDRGFVTYSNVAKEEAIGVDSALIAAHGAVSEEVARAMAEGAKATAQTDWGVGVTGIAGPGGGTPDKPVGTVWIAVAGPDGTHTRRLRLGRDRTSNRRFSAWIALEMLRRQILRRAS